MSKPTLPVLFRVTLTGLLKGDVTAVFPTEPGRVGDPDSMVCYDHVGQHGYCTAFWLRRRTRPATEAERGPLLRELQTIYSMEPDPVTLEVVPRRTASHRRQRLAQVR